ncbi:unnamed protein product [Symbiodinium pilosum]|uniref:Uncharacterized protein n=1 Tax=Symbiodinium pilosum TaxID=2952 RepID=A0A812VW26_SYMPI|nr:unnamed protein product [Symbiodinium pilosum]
MALIWLLLGLAVVGAVRDSDMQLESSDSHGHRGHRKSHHKAHHHHHHKHKDMHSDEAAEANEGFDSALPSALPTPPTPPARQAEPFAVGSLLTAHQHRQHRHHLASSDFSDSDACQEEVDLHQPQKLLEALRRCLEARKELSIKTQELLKEEKEGGKIYATEVTGIMNLIKKVQDANRMDEPWKKDHAQVLAQLLEQTGEAEKEAEAVWQEKPAEA